ncbi:MAG: tRNA-intron lyase [Candidatus Woesearchaeota archaeon]
MTKQKSEEEISGIKSLFGNEQVVTEDSDAARDLYNQSRFGNLSSEGRVELSLIEGLYLFEKKKIVVLDGKNKPITFEAYIKKARRFEPNFWVRYCVYKDMRNRGYIVKTALKFGADFRIYDRGVKPGEDHAKWILYPVHEGNEFSWYEFAAKNRVAHSTRKRLLIGIVDEERDVTYYEIAWKRP